jgi:hypothetical protein
MTTTPRKRAPRTRKPVAPKPATPPPVQDVEDIGHPPMDIEPAYDLANYHDGDDPRPSGNTPLVLMGCMFILSMSLMGSVTAFVVYDRFFRNPTPDVAPVVVPVNNLSAFTAPITAKLATDSAKAKIVADAYTGLTAAIAGKTGERLTSSRIFEEAHAAFLTDIDAMGGVAVGAEIDQAIGSYLGMTKTTGADGGWEPIAFDASHRVKLVEITAAIAEAAEAAQ